MTISQSELEANGISSPDWLMLLFTLPASQASKRVEVWRKLKRYGALTFRSSGYLLPNSPVNHERFEWLSAAIRKYKGEASVVELVSIDDVPAAELKQLFIEARSADYEKLLRELKKTKQSPGTLPRIRRRLQEVIEVDFFGSHLRSRVETALAALENPKPEAKKAVKHVREKFQGRTWITRPRPGIDRVSSAWLIRNHIDPDAKFLFTNDAKRVPNGIPFDMFNVGGFTHHGENCTFETLCVEFALRDRKIKVLAEIIHDADLSDEKFGRADGIGLDRVLNGWAKQGLSDEELLKRGMDLIDGLYREIG
jgi:disulfide oxidoreductase YuzD